VTEPDVVVDARGLRCPLPVIRLAAAARGVEPGTVLTVVATDPAAEYDVPAWARLRGHRLTASRYDEAAGEWTVTVETVGPSPAA
jgi:tRNA 2-thiouridine synthesizing protein A